MTELYRLSCEGLMGTGAIQERLPADGCIDNSSQFAPSGSQAPPAVYTLGRTEEFHIRPITLELADARES